MTDLDLADAVYGNQTCKLDAEPEQTIDIEEPTEESHPLTIVLDTVIKTSDSYLKTKNSPSQTAKPTQPSPAQTSTKPSNNSSPQKAAPSSTPTSSSSWDSAAWP